MAAAKKQCFFAISVLNWVFTPAIQSARGLQVTINLALM